MAVALKEIPCDYDLQTHASCKVAKHEHVKK